MKDFNVTPNDMRDNYDQLLERITFYEKLNSTTSATVESRAILGRLNRLRDLWWACYEELALINYHESVMDA